MYLYFDKKGTLLEVINDEALRQYNVGVNTLRVYIEPDVEHVVESLTYWFQLGDGTTLNKGYSTKEYAEETIPFNRDRDLKHFEYGKKYKFFIIEVPCGDIQTEINKTANCLEVVSDGNVFAQSGLVLTSIQAVYESGFALTLEKVAFMVESSVVLSDGIVSGAEFNWLLNKYALEKGPKGDTGDDGVGIEKIEYAYNNPVGNAVYRIILTDSTSYLFVVPKGEKGNTGNDGNDYLYCLAQVESDHIVYSVGDEITIPSNGFNRTPSVGEYFFVSVKHSVKVNPYLYYAKVTSSFASGNTVAEIVNVCIGEKGPKGDTGLYYIKTISLDDNANLTTTSLKKDDFSRRPTKDEYCIAIATSSTGTRTYIITLKIVFVDDSENAQVELNSIVNTTGVDALVYKTYSVSELHYGEYWEDTLTGFNRTPKKNERFIMYSTKNQYAIMRITSVTDEWVSYETEFIINTKGNDGADGTIFTPSVSKVGVLSWTNNGGLDNPEEVNIKGDTGDKGDDGVGIEKIEYAYNNPVGNAVYRIILTDSTSYLFVVPKGEKGNTGNDGNDYLYCLAQVESDHIVYSVGDEITIPSSGFNRTPSVGEYFFVSVKHSVKVNPYLYYAKVTSSFASGNTIAEIVNVCIGEKGPKGDTGDDGADGVNYLYYNKIFSGKRQINDIVTYMDYADFNRTPIVGDRLFYITQETRIDGTIVRFVYYGVITVASGDYATMRILASCNGEDGANGQQGEKGEKGEKGDKGDTALTVTVGTVTTGDAGSDASVVNSGTDTDLVLDFTLPKGANGDDCLYYTNDSNIPTNYSLDEVGVQANIEISNFNRTPKVDERFIAVIYNSRQEKTAFFKVESVVDLTATVKVVSYLSVELPESTATVELNKYTLNVADTLAGRKRLYDVITGAKGNVMLYSYDYAMPLSFVVYGTMATNTKLYISGTKTSETSVTTLTLTVTSSGSIDGGYEYHSVQNTSGITFDRKVSTSNIRCVYYNDTEIT